MCTSGRCLALFYASLCSASTLAQLFPSGTHIDQTIEELLVTTDADEFGLFRRLLERAAFDEPFENATIFLPLSTPEPFEALLSQYLNDTQWELHARDIVNTMVYEGTIQSLGLFLASSLTMRNGEELQVSTSSVQNGTVEFTLENPSLRSLPPAQIVVTDISAANGVTIHLTDALVPPSWGFSDFHTLVLNDIVAVTSTFPDAIGMIFLFSPDFGNALTILVPVNAAFIAKGDDFLTFYKDPAHLEELRVLVKSHILSGVYPFSRAQDGDTLTSLAGFEVAISVDDNSTVFFNGAKFIESRYFLAVNGIAYVVDDAILPPSRNSSIHQPPVSPPTIEPSNAPATANNSNIHGGNATFETEIKTSDDNKGEGGLSGGAIAATVLGGAAAFVLIGLYSFWKISSNKKTASDAPLPMAAALSTTDVVSEDPPTTIEPAIVEVLPAIQTHSERVASIPRVYNANEQGGAPACDDLEQNANDQLRNVAITTASKPAGEQEGHEEEEDEIERKNEVGLY